MATLHLENVPDDLLEAIEDRASEEKTTVELAVLHVLSRMFPTKAQLAVRQDRMKRFLELQKATPPGEGPFPSAEEMIREDRNR
jgi:hypothetical protein